MKNDGGEKNFHLINVLLVRLRRYLEAPYSANPGITADGMY
jgi:hypothetical protein